MQKNKTVILFLIKFFGSYAILFLLYTFYLNKNQGSVGMYSCAPITELVAKQSNYLINLIGYTSKIQQSTTEMSIHLIINQKSVAKVIEGCNAISIIILFIAFIIAFSGKLKPTLLFIIAGSLLIYFINIVRISAIAIALYEYPEYERMLHDSIFPLMIYGTTFLLWIVWVTKFLKLK